MHTHYPRALLALPVLLAGHLSHAQHSGLGFKLGPSACTFGTSATDFSPIIGYVAGLYACRWMTDDLSFQPELLYARAGADRVVDKRFRQPVRLSYVRLPLLLKFAATDQWSLHFGADPGYMLGQRSLMNEAGTGTSSSYRHFDLATVLGANLDLQDRLALSIRYSYGLTTLTTVDDPGGFPTNRGVQVTLQYEWVDYLTRARTRCHPHRGSKSQVAHSRLRLW